MTEEPVLTENNCNQTCSRLKKGGGAARICPCLQFLSVTFYKNLTFDIRLNNMIVYMFHILCKNKLKL